MLWAGATLLTLIAVGLVVWPLLRPRQDGDLASRQTFDLAVYRDQLTELERDRERGVIEAEAADQARIEIQRRMLAAAAESETKPASAPGLAKPLAGLLALILIGGGAALYAALGSPNLPDRPRSQVLADRLGMAPDEAAKMAGLVETLAEKLNRQPNDANGWLMLGRSYRALARYDESVEAYRRAIALGIADGETLSDLGEVLTNANDGQIGAEALGAFYSALKLIPGQPKSMFYIGAAKDQIDDTEGAIATWKQLEQDSPPDAVWMPMLRQRIAEAAKRINIDPRLIKPAKPDLAKMPAHPVPGPMGDGLQPAPDQAAMIGQMVERLETRLRDNPADAEGWSRLGRSYSVLAQPEKAAMAYAKAHALNPNDLDVKLAYAIALVEEAKSAPGGKVPKSAENLLREVMAKNPDSLDATYLVGLAESEAGNVAAARALWEKVRDKLPPGAPDRKEVEDRLAGLPKK